MIKKKGAASVLARTRTKRRKEREEKERNIVGFVKEMKGERERVFIESVRSVLTLKENKKKDKEQLQSGVKEEEEREKNLVWFELEIVKCN